MAFGITALSEAPISSLGGTGVTVAVSGVLLNSAIGTAHEQ